MQKERRQREHRDRVGPLEDPVEAIEPTAERKREHAEECDCEPEEVQRRRVARPPQPDGAADKQSEDPDTGKDEVQRPWTVRNGGEPNVDDFTAAEPERGIAQRSIASRRV